MLAPVTGLTQTAQDATGTSFTWDAVPGADSYAVQVDGVTLTSVTVPAVKVLIAAGSHVLGVIPVALATPPTTLAFTVPPPPPNPPTGLTAVASSSTRVNLGWNPVPGALAYDVWRNGAIAFTTTATTLSDGTVDPSTTYNYQVDVQTAAGTSVPSTPPVQVTTPATPPQVPPPPTGLVATLTGTQAAPTVTLTWNPSPGATSYDIYRNGVLIASPSAS